MALLLSVGTLWKRELIRFFRQKGRVVGALGTPLIFWLVIGSGLGASFHLPGAPDVDYLEYFFPGTVLLIILFTAIFSSLSVIEDRKEGFLLSVLVAPVYRISIALGKILGCATLAFLQGFLLILMAPLVGIHLSWMQLLLVAGLLLLISLCMAALGFATAWATESVQGYHSIMNVLLLPMWLLSGAVFPMSGAFSWIRWTMLLNPLTYAFVTLQYSLGSSMAAADGLPSFSVSLLITFLFGIIVFVISFRLVQRGKVKGLS